MNILGIGGFSHDSSAALLCDGRVVAAAEEERFTRKKHQNGWPRHAIDFCLKQAGIRESELDHISFYWRPWSLDSLREIGQRIAYLPIHPVYSGGFLLQRLHDTAWYMFHLRRLRDAGGRRAKIHFVRHHDCHAGSAFFCSPWDEAAVLTIDARGEWATTVWYHGKGNRLNEIGRINLPHSIGILYVSVTNFLGFETGDEYKVMGLAAYGEPRYVEEFRRIVQWRPDGSYRLDTSYLTVQHSPGRFAGYVSRKFTDVFGRGRRRDEEISQDHKDIAASLQTVLEEVVFHMLVAIHKATGCRRLCLAGGVAQNSVLCGKITSQTPFEELFVQPAAGDNGCSLGGAAWVSHHLLQLDRGQLFPGCYLGPEFHEPEIATFLESTGLKYSKPQDIAATVARLITSGKIVGWFQGRMEWGARALGNRSILADVTDPEMTNTVNRRVKHREDFRPFAPACIEERAHEFFDVSGAAPYMMEVHPAKATAKKSMPAIVHVDGSARLQTVTSSQNPMFYQLLKEIESQTGIPCVLNTSFNIKGEPIVCAPIDAVKCWATTGIDALALGPFLLEK